MENSTKTPEPTNEQKPVQQAGQGTQIPIPNATTVLVLGIISIATFCCFGIVGLTLGIIALILGGKSKKLYNENPERYTEGSYKNLNAGYICAIIGTSLSGLWILYAIIQLVVVGATLGNLFKHFPWENINF